MDDTPHTISPFAETMGSIYIHSNLTYTGHDGTIGTLQFEPRIRSSDLWIYYIYFSLRRVF